MAALVLVRESGMSGEKLWELIRKADVKDGAPEPATKPMRLTQFWRLLETTSPCRDCANELVQSLARLRPQSIRGFHERLARLLYELDGPEHAARGAEPDDDYLSPDRFLYQRCWVVGQGRAVFQATLSDPTKMPFEDECEDLIAAAPRALARLEDQDDDECYIPTSVSYETYSNKARWRGSPET